MSKCDHCAKLEQQVLQQAHRDPDMRHIQVLDEIRDLVVDRLRQKYLQAGQQQQQRG